MTPQPLMVELHGKMVDWVKAVGRMDPHITKTLDYLYPCSEQAYLNVYAIAHQVAHGKPFEVK